MQAPTITKRYLRLSSGIALAIILVASLSAYSVSLSGQRHVIESAHHTRIVDRIMVTLADMSLIFDTIKRDQDSQVAKRAMSRLHQTHREGEAALHALHAAHDQFSHSEEAHRILNQSALNPLDEYESMLAVALLAVDDERSQQQRVRAAALGVEMSRKLMPVFVKLSEAESRAAAGIAQKQSNYSLLAILIAVLGIFVVVRFVHLPMERFVISAAKEIERNRQKAEEASDAKSAFLATMSHEIRTPLNGVMGLSELLQDTEKDPDRRRMLDMIVSSGHALLQIINDVLDLSKIEAGKVSLDQQVFDVRQTCEEVVELFRAQAHSKDIGLTLQVSPEAGFWRVKGPGKAVRQVVLNLVNNAVKFTDEGRIVVKLEALDQALFTQESAERRFRISVQDSGIGISEDAIGHIFDQFAQADASTTTRYGGTGLGLAIAKQLSEVMGGAVHAKSTPGIGSTFTMEFPAIAQPPAAPATNAAPNWRRFEGRVLVVDDNAVNRLVAEKMLMKMGCSVKQATNGLEAIGVQQTWAPDLILMDIRMPDMDGLEATKRLRAEGATTPCGPVPIIGLSANALVEQRDEAIAAGMTGYLTKPLKKDALIAALSAHLRFVSEKNEGPGKCA